MSELAIEIKNLHKVYKRGLFGADGIFAVNDLSLEINQGEIWALAGPNGAGKTTTLHCLVGLLYPSKGTVRIFGKDPVSSCARKSVGFQSEIFFSYGYHTPFNALKLYGRLSGMEDLTLEKKIDEMLNLVGLSDVRNQDMQTFSKGMMQRVGLAQSILHDPDIIIWDEPSTGLDPEGRRLVADLITQLKARGRTILLSTHILSDIERVCDHIVIIDKGRALASSRIETLMNENPGKTLEDIYLDTVRRVEHA